MKKALFIGYVWPEPKTTAAGHRMLQLLTSFKEDSYRVVFASTAQQTAYSANLSELGFETAQIKLNHNSFNDFIKDLEPDVVIFDRFMIEEQFGWRVAENAPKALRILNTEDLHSLRNTREISHKKGEQFTSQKWMVNDMAKREIASIYRSDLSLLISSTETNLLKNVFHISEDLLLTLPFMLDPLEKNCFKGFPEFEERENFVFIGNGKHAPNVDAISFLKTRIWPLIVKELPTTSLNIYGAYLPQQVKEMHKPSENFNVHGWAENLDKKLQATRINLAPLRFGAGLKGKVIDGMRNGTPTITTTIGAEGIANYNAIYDTPEAFAKAAITSYTQKTTWEQLQKEEIRSINTHFNKEKNVAQLFDTLTRLQTNLEKQRDTNFIGSLLQHQSMASNKFMSKWIEEKNKKK